MEVTIIGGGLSGCEAAWQLAMRGYDIKLYEMRPSLYTPAHKTDLLAELVCSNSLKSMNLDTASGLLKNELKFYNSLILDKAFNNAVPAGSALAVDRDLFSKDVTDAITATNNITIIREEVKSIPNDGIVLLACGPLASDSISESIKAITGESPYFVDAISPVISSDSIDYSKGFFASRYDKGGGDYFNIGMNEEQFNRFYEALISAEYTELHDFEDATIFERCMPIEIMAKRGIKTLLFGPMRPVGLYNPVTKEKYFAVVQLRQENKDRTAFNIVGFQTKMRISSQKDVIRLIPGLENADFLRYGSIHRNTYINSPNLLNPNQSFKACKDLFIAGQITGVEGYLESVASGLMAALQIDAYLKDKKTILFSEFTPFGALQKHLSGEFGDKSYLPSNFHFGMLPPPEDKIRSKKDRKLYYSIRAEKFFMNN